MSDEERAFVNDFIGDEETSVLYFMKDDKTFVDIPFHELQDLVLNVIFTASHMESYQMEEGRPVYQCRPGANRSALDIWRHCKYYLPDTTIFDVMRVLYRVTAGTDPVDRDLTTFICGDIDRRVFQICRDQSRNAGTQRFGMSERDEFGLLFSEWESI